MKTFEERHADWLDGRLDETERAIFEGELASQHGLNPVAERVALARLSVALREHMAFTRMPNPDFFNHRLLERIHADREASARATGAAGGPVWFRSTISRLALVGAAALMLGEALPAWKLAATGLVMAGLALNVVAGRGAARGVAVAR